MRLRPIALVAVFALVACGGGSGGGAIVPRTNDNAIPTNAVPASAIPEVRSVNGVASLDLAAAIDPATNAPAFRFAGAFVAPTIRLRAGETLRIRYTNALPAGSTARPNHTNLHFHGLTVSPDAPGDDVLTTDLAPGANAQYVVQIPADQPPGLYWYHPHPHGETEWQVGNGMAGALIVEGIADEIPAAANLRERLVIVRDVFRSPTLAAKTLDRRICGLDRLPASARLAALAASGGRHRLRSGVDTQLTIDGSADAPSFAIASGERQLVRLVNAAPNRSLDIALDGAPLRVVAVDGVPLRDAAGAPPQTETDHLVVPPAGRVEFIVTGTGAPFALRTRSVDAGPDGDAPPGAVLAVFAPGAGPSSIVAARPSRAIVHAYRDALPAPSASRTIRFTEDAQNGAFFIDGALFDRDAPPHIVARAGTVEEWTLVNDTDELHAFHPHQAHFLVEDVNGTPVSPRVWTDTVTLPYRVAGINGTHRPGVVRVLVDFRDPVLRGTFVFHCHLLEHEDGGMMAKIQVN